MGVGCESDGDYTVIDQASIDALKTKASRLLLDAGALTADGVTPPPPPTGSVFDTLARNTARLMGSYVNPDPNWFPKGRSITDDGGCCADPARHQYLLMGGSHGISQEDEVRAFDTLTGTWRNLYESTPWADMVPSNFEKPPGRWASTNHPVCRHTYSHMVVRGDRLYLMQSYCNPDNLPPPTTSLPSFHARLCWYDLVNGGWNYSARVMAWTHASASVLDPVSQNIYVFGLDINTAPGRVWKYDPVADTITTGPTMSLNTQPTDAVYCPDDDKFYAFDTGGVIHKITVDRANLNNSTSFLLPTMGPRPIQTAENTPTGRPRGYPSFTWDTVNKRMGGCFVDGIHYQFDPVALTWTATTVLVEGSPGGSPPSNDFSCSAFDESSGCYIFVQNAPVGGARTWAYRP